MLTLGIDIGTSGVRGSLVDEAGVEVAASRRALPREQTAQEWKHAAFDVIRELAQQTHKARIAALAVDGTSSTVMLIDREGQPCSRPMMYHEQSCSEEAAIIDRIAPQESPARGAGSSLAKAMHLLADASGAAHIVHQADWLTGLLSGRHGISDENNCLKTGYDPVARRWPAWIEKTGLDFALLPEVLEPGQVISTVDAAVATNLGLPADCRVVAGTTDSIAAFLATGAGKPGDAVTSLGSTLVIKQVADRPVHSARQGIYSHRLGELWLAGGASNAGGKALLEVFSQSELDALTPQLRPDEPTGLDYYPLPVPGERFPFCDPDKLPRMEPRPDDDARYLQGLLESLARIEARGYAMLQQLGAGDFVRVYTCGGGSTSEPWRKIRERELGVPVITAEYTEASYGAAILARQACSHTRI